MSAAKLRLKSMKGSKEDLEGDLNTLKTKDDIRREKLYQSKGVS